jgi:hypothetical protein
MNKNFSFLILIILFFLSSCAQLQSIDKRHYRKGFYIQDSHRSDRKISSVAGKDILNIQPVNDSDEFKINNSDTISVIDSAKSFTPNLSVPKFIFPKKIMLNSFPSLPKIIQKVKHKNPLRVFHEVKNKNEKTAKGCFITAIVFAALATLFSLILLFADFSTLPFAGLLIIVLLLIGILSSFILAIVFFVIGLVIKNEQDQPDEKTRSETR